MNSAGATVLLSCKSEKDYNFQLEGKTQVRRRIVMIT